MDPGTWARRGIMAWRWRWGAIGLPVLLAVLILVARPDGAPGTMQVPLADGSILIVHAFTWGRSQDVSLDPAWKAWLRERLPSCFQARLAPNRVFTLRGEEEAHLWLSRRDPATGAYLLLKNHQFAAVDNQGRVFPSTGGSGWGLSTNRMLFAARFPATAWAARGCGFLSGDGPRRATNKFASATRRFRDDLGGRKSARFRRRGRGTASRSPRPRSSHFPGSKPG